MTFEPVSLATEVPTELLSRLLLNVRFGSVANAVELLTVRYSEAVRIVHQSGLADEIWWSNAELQLA
jgi:hypothetical protein